MCALVHICVVCVHDVCMHTGACVYIRVSALTMALAPICHPSFWTLGKTPLSPHWDDGQVWMQVFNCRKHLRVLKSPSGNPAFGRECSHTLQGNVTSSVGIPPPICGVHSSHGTLTSYKQPCAPVCLRLPFSCCLLPSAALRAAAGWGALLGLPSPTCSLEAERGAGGMDGGRGSCYSG